MHVSSDIANSPNQLNTWLSDFCERNNCKLIAVDGKAYIFEVKDPTGDFVYLGFNVHQMLYFINKYCDSVKLEKVDNNWRLYLLSKEAGEYENEGCLSTIVSQAFKPFVEKAKTEQQEMKKVFNGIFD